MKVFNPQWDRDMDIDDKLVEFMHAAGYEDYHTGGGCMAWLREEKYDRQFYTLITVNGCDLGKWAERDDKVWEVGRYHTTDTNDCYLFFNQNLTLDRAIEVARRMPDPQLDQESDLIEDENGLLSKARED